MEPPGSVQQACASVCRVTDRPVTCGILRVMIDHGLIPDSADRTVTTGGRSGAAGAGCVGGLVTGIPSVRGQVEPSRFCTLKTVEYTQLQTTVASRNGDATGRDAAASGSGGRPGRTGWITTCTLDCRRPSTPAFPALVRDCELRMSVSQNLRSGVLFLLIGLTAALAFSPGHAGSPGSRTLTSDNRQAVNRGVELERSRKWLDAIVHYEKSVKQYPDCGELQSGMRRAKVHFSVDRRYCDGSYHRSLLTQTRAEAVTLFDDILNRTQAHYVEPISLTSFVAHGTESLYQALDEPRFLEENVPADRRDRASAVRAELSRPGEFWNRRISDRDDARRFIDQVCRLCQKELELEAVPVVMEYVFGGCNALDDYSSLLTPGRYTDLMSNIRGEFVGLGVEIKAEPEQGLILVNVLPGSPADEGGLLAGEHIVSIDGRDVRNATTDEAASYLQGTAGSKVTLEVLRGAEDTLRRLTLVRRPVVIKSIPVAEIIERRGGVGYIQLASFQDSTVQELDAALQELNQQGMRSLILDVRGNPGGLLNAAVDVLDRFIGEGVLVETRGRTPDQNVKYRGRDKGTWKLPVVLLIDGDSASASEIVAGAFKDHRRGTIIGRKSFGKWSVQSILSVRGKCGLRITTAKFYSPNGHTLGKVGVRPDIEVPEPERPRNHFRAPNDIDVEGDEDLQQALRLLRNEVASR